MIWQLDLILLTLVVICAAAALAVKNLFSATVLFGAFSFLMCMLWTEMGAVDVAFTEAAVGAGVSTAFFIAAIFQTTRVGILEEVKGLKVLAFIVTLMTGALLIYATVDFPDWGDPNSPASLHVSPRYIEKTIEETAIPNMVTSLLADYRGYDTNFEETVILTAGVAAIMLLRRPRK